MTWIVTIHKKAAKGIAKMNKKAQMAMRVLTEDLKSKGPSQTGWPHYSKLKGHYNCHHCHLNRGRPTYVVCWKEQEHKQVEVYYAGTRQSPRTESPRLGRKLTSRIDQTKKGEIQST